jgi:ribosomal protein S18 acetylase RimI-like enzyme
MAAVIRPYEKKDQSYVEQICIATAGPGFAETPLRKKAAVAAFCRYFITHCPETCFVAADESDIPVGYILCTTSFGNWCKHGPEQFLTSFPFGLLWSIGSMLGGLPYVRSYPAHLHINLLPPYQRQGLGRQLMQALEQELRKRNCSGVSLCVDKNNHGAMRFYESCGFHVLGRHSGSVAYGKILNEVRR